MLNMTEAEDREEQKMVEEALDVMLKQLEDDFEKNGYEERFPMMTKEDYALIMMGTFLSKHESN